LGDADWGNPIQYKMKMIMESQLFKHNMKFKMRLSRCIMENPPGASTVFNFDVGLFAGACNLLGVERDTFTTDGIIFFFSSLFVSSLELNYT